MPLDQLKRREFITLLGGAAAWPHAAWAQQPERVRRIGVLMSLAADDPEGQARLAAFLQGLQELGWTDGLNVSVDVRSTAGDAERIRREAVKLVAFAPDVILAVGGQVVGGLLQATRTVPVVFTQSNGRAWLYCTCEWRTVYRDHLTLPTASNPARSMRNPA
jgi:putative ABC transport system substrate-binding protein